MPKENTDESFGTGCLIGLIVGFFIPVVGIVVGLFFIGLWRWAWGS